MKLSKLFLTGLLLVNTLTIFPVSAEEEALNSEEVVLEEVNQEELETVEAQDEIIIPEVTIPEEEPTTDENLEVETTEEVEPTEDPIIEVTPEVTPEPTPEVTPEVTVEPTPEVTAEPTLEPTPEITLEPTIEPTVEPTIEPTETPEVVEELEEAEEVEAVTESLEENELMYAQYGVNQVWRVNNNWEFKILGVENHNACNQFSDKTGEQVVIVYYQVKNIGYNGDLRMGIDAVYDQDGNAAQTYPCTHVLYAKPLSMNGSSTIGSEAFILPKKSKSITIYVDGYTNNPFQKHSTTFSASVSNSQPNLPWSTKHMAGEKQYDYKANQKWKVNNNWEFTITKATNHYECNSYSDDIGEQVVLIDFNYINIGYYNDYGSGLYMTINNVYDEFGNAAQSYPCTHEKSSQSLYVENTRCDASEAFILPKKSKYIFVQISEYTHSPKFEEKKVIYAVPIGNNTVPSNTLPKVQAVAIYNSAHGADIRWKPINGIRYYGIWRKRTNPVTKVLEEKIVKIIDTNSYTTKEGGNYKWIDPYLKDKYTEKGKEGEGGWVYYVTARSTGDTSEQYNDGKHLTIDGPISNKLNLYRLRNPEIKTVTANGNGKVTVTYSNVPTAHGYEVQYTLDNGKTWTKMPENIAAYWDSNGKEVKVAGYKPQVTITGLPKGKKVNFRIRCRKTNTNLGVTWSEYSPWKSGVVK